MLLLPFPTKKPFDAYALDEKIKEMLQSLNYIDSLDDLGKLGRRFLRNEWYLFFDQIAKAFKWKCSGYDDITYITC